MIDKQEIIDLLAELPDDTKIGGFVIIAIHNDNMGSTAHKLDADDCYGVCDHDFIEHLKTVVRKWQKGETQSGDEMTEGRTN